MRSSDLFNARPSLLSWLPNESLFSLVSRQHAFWGNSNSAETARVLFGRGHSGIHHDLPNALGEFASRTSEALGSADEIARTRTLLSFYRPFLSEALFEEAVQTMCGDSVAHLRYRLGLQTSGFRANHPLKACPSCMEDDRRDTGWSYWHLDHQFPGVWFCGRHGLPLLESRVKSTGVGRFLWCLPELQQLSSAWTSSTIDDSALRKLSALTLELHCSNRETGWLQGEKVVPVLRAAAGRNGWVTANGSLKVSEFSGLYSDWCQDLQGPSELEALPLTVADAGMQLGRLLRPWRKGTHPLRLLVAIGFLFEDTNTFLKAYETYHYALVKSLDGRTDVVNEKGHAAVSADPARSRLLDLVKNRMSATRAAATVGINVGTAMAWLAQAHIAVKRRPKTLTSSIQSALKGNLLAGVSKTHAATRQGVTVQAVTRFLRTDPGLHQAWQEAVFQRRKRTSRSKWLRCLELHGKLGIKWMRAQDPANYAWLYRNDKQWLSANLPHRLPSSNLTTRVKWDERDLGLSAAVNAVALKLKELHPRKAIRLWQIYQELPQLRPKLSVLDKLPLTRKAIERAVERAGTRTTNDLL